MIDQEIRDALKVDPSPEFLARVRTRIANEPAPSRWRWSWTFAAAGAVAATIVIAALVSRPPALDGAQASGPGLAGLRPRATQEPAQQQAAETQQPAAAQQRPDVAQAFTPATAGLKPRATVPVGSSFSRAVSPRAPEILIDPAERRALQGLIAGVRDGRVDLTAVQQSAVPAPMDLEPVTDIVIAPITIEPLAPLAGAEGVRP